MYFVVGFLFLIVLTAAYAGVRAAPWVPTRGKDVERFMDLVNVKPGEKVYDLGCGDGRMICAMAEKGAKAEGFEISLLLYFVAKIRSFFVKKGSVRVRYKDFWYADLKDADVIYFFLMKKVYPKLKLKFKKELKKGTKVVAYVWPIEGWKPVKISKLKGNLDLYLYEM